MPLSQTIRWILHVFSVSIIIPLSLILSLRLLGHSLGIRGIRLRPFSISLYGLKYTYTTTHSISSPHLHVSLHLPRPSSLTLLTATLYDYHYTDPIHEVSLSKLYLVFSLFPNVPETFISIVLDDFRVRIFSSMHTPGWVETLRRNLVSTALNGQTVRVDDFVTNIVLSTMGIRGRKLIVEDDDEDEYQSDQDDEKKSCQPETGPENQNTEMNDDEAVVTLTVSQWHIKNFRGRLYSFGSLNAQLRRSWEPNVDRGTFVLVAKNCSWVLAPQPPPVSPTPAHETGLYRLFLTALQFLRHPAAPLFILFKTIHDPGSAVTLHVPRLDVVFDQFRLQDAELVRQGATFVRREYEGLKNKQSADVSGFFWDMLWQGVLGQSHKRGESRE
ncbi:hypothetical protein Hypma_016109 [Hypsizygus marmoreus]|uniref:Uncharacterized protein n=1 Tax=Hypsizygus marmoreus TaxID=39966 RepID=A0A369K8K5_HYPMA|nr:hypothetical protein Hypma_016109 [Hypsizygus marmoreus]